MIHILSANILNDIIMAVNELKEVKTTVYFKTTVENLYLITKAIIIK